MANKVNLNKLREEIDSRKNERNMVPSKLGENAGRGIAPRDTFLNGLLESLYSGRETASSALVKTVDNKVAAKKGESRLPISEVVSPQQHQAPQRINEYDLSPERDEQLFADLEKKRKQTLAESIEGYTRTPNMGAPMQNNQNMGAPMQLNETYLTENVKRIVNDHLIENFGPIVEEAIRSTIIEMYATERIKEVMNENKNLIRAVVIDTIKEIQNKNKQKA